MPAFTFSLEATKQPFHSIQMDPMEELPMFNPPPPQKKTISCVKLTRPRIKDISPALKAVSPACDKTVAASNARV